MPRGKRYTPEKIEAAEIIQMETPMDAEPKTKTPSTKVTLVKPMQANEESSVSEQPAATDIVSTDVMPEIAPENTSEAVKKSAPRPKVGRSSTARKKNKNDDKGVKKESKSRKKAEIKTEIVAQPAPAELSTEALPPIKQDVAFVVEKKTPYFSDAPAAQTEALSKKLPLQVLREELAQAEQASGWNPEHTRPQSFKSILFAVVLFVVINLGFMMLFSASHKSKVLSPVAAPLAATQPAGVPPVPFADEQHVKAPAAIAPASVTQAPAAKAASSILAAPGIHRTDVSNATAAPSEPVEVSTLPPALPAAAIEASLPIIPPAAEAPHTVSAIAPVSVAKAPAPSVAQAPAATAASAPKAVISDKAVSSQELLSILDKTN